MHELDEPGNEVHPSRIEFLILSSCSGAEFRWAFRRTHGPRDPGTLEPRPGRSSTWTGRLDLGA